MPGDGRYNLRNGGGLATRASLPVPAFAEYLGTADGDGTTSYYVDMLLYRRWAIQFSRTIADAETITLTVHQSAEDEADSAAATYEEVTETFFGMENGFTDDAWIEPELPTACRWLRIDVTVSGYTMGEPAWQLYIVTTPW